MKKNIFGIIAVLGIIILMIGFYKYMTEKRLNENYESRFEEYYVPESAAGILNVMQQLNPKTANKETARIVDHLNKMIFNGGFKEIKIGAINL